MGEIGSVAIALLSGAGFLGAALITVAGSKIATGLRPYVAPVAAGILIALAFGDVFPEAIAASTTAAILGFAVAFSVLYLIETLTHSPEHGGVHAPTPSHELATMMTGLAVHNIADGFAIGVTSELSGAAASLLGLGVLVHQIPVGLSFAALLLGVGASRRQIGRTAIVMAVLIPAAAALTVLLPVASARAVGALLGASAGLLVYIGAAHLLPEVHADRHNRGTALVFVGTLLLMAIVTVTFIAEG